MKVFDTGILILCDNYCFKMALLLIILKWHVSQKHSSVLCTVLSISLYLFKQDSYILLYRREKKGNKFKNTSWKR